MFKLEPKKKVVKAQVKVAKPVAIKVPVVEVKKVFDFTKIFNLVKEDKVIVSSANEWVDEHGHVINKYIYSEKWKYHLKLKNEIFNLLKALNRDEQEEFAKVIGVEVDYSMNERRLIELFLKKII